jgi:TatD DNase family protein
MEPKNLYYIDIHMHLGYEKSKILKNIFENNNIIGISNSTDYKDYLLQEKLKKEKIPNLYFANGLYPDTVINNSYERNIELINKIDYKNSFCIGEIGIDYKITKNKELRKLQKKIFNKQLEIAEKYNKVVMVHSRFSTKRVLEELKSYNVDVLLHWFSGNNKELKQVVDNGYYISLNYDRNNVIKDLIHLDRIFLETDYPIPYNNNKVEIIDIKNAYKLFSKKYNIDIVELKKRLQTNFITLFKNLKNKYEF